MDIARALCLGANGCLIGRPFLFGLAAAGGDPTGVVRAVELLTGELERTMALLGVTSVAGLGRECVHSAR